METKTTTTLGRKTMATMRIKGPHLGTWMAPDPMAEKYPGMSPFVYCAGDPVNVVDPDGLDTLYAQTFWRQVKMIGETPDNTGKKYLVRGSTKRAAKRAFKDNESYNGNLQNANEVFELPSTEVLDAIDASLERAAQTHLEQGGHIIEGSTEVVEWDPGIAPHYTADNSVSQSIVPFVVNGHKVPVNGSHLSLYWHVHATNDFENTEFGYAAPSKGDLSFQTKLNNHGYKGNGIVIGERDNKVSIYNGNRTLFKINYQVFKTLCK